MTKKIYKISNLDCPSCAALLESDLEDCGIKAKCNFAKSTLEVELGEEKYEEKVISTVKKNGYCLE